MGKERLTVRLSAAQMQVLSELRDALGVNISLLIRTIVGSWLRQNEDTLERIIAGEQEYINPFTEEENKTGCYYTDRDDYE
jgi:hypothetical protein